MLVLANINNHCKRVLILVSMLSREVFFPASTGLSTAICASVGYQMISDNINIISISGIDFVQSSSYCGRCSFHLVSIRVTNGHTRKIQEVFQHFPMFRHGRWHDMGCFHLRTSQAKAALAMWKQMAPEKKRGCARLARV